MSDDDKTILRPQPGGRRPRPGGRRPTPAAGRKPRDETGMDWEFAPAPGAAEPVARSGRSPLIKAASPLLALIPKLRESLQAPDTRALRRYVLEEISNFEASARRAGIGSERIENCRYVLCTTLDEMVLNSPWGARSEWANHSLMAQLHHGTEGGKRVFQMLKEYLQDPAGCIDELELIYYCLALGFQGQYRVTADGRDRLESIRDRVANTIRNQRGPPEDELSRHWEGVSDRRNPIIRHVPVWVAGALALGILAATYIGFLFSINSYSDPVIMQLATLPSAIQTPAETRDTPPSAPPPPPSQSLRNLLSNEIDRGLVEVREDAYQAQLIIRGDTVNLFRSGSATIDPARYELVASVGYALSQTPGSIRVIGHTDSVPIRTIRYPSNWHLSKARADEVARALSHMLGGAREVLGDGRGHSEPIASNDTAADRARNRRVEILVIK